MKGLEFRVWAWRFELILGFDFVACDLRRFFEVIFEGFKVIETSGVSGSRVEASGSCVFWLYRLKCSSPAMSWPIRTRSLNPPPPQPRVGVRAQ